MAVTDYLERGASIAPDKVCVRMGTGVLTYRELLTSVNRIANTLLSLCDGPGHNAAVLADNAPRAYACTLGVMRAGTAYVPLDFRNQPVENQRILEFADVELLFFGRRFEEQIASMRPSLPKLQHLVCIDGDCSIAPGVDAWSEHASAQAPALEIPLEAPAWLQSNSGTTGDFRMTVMPHRMLHSFVAYQLILLPGPAPVMLIAAPITHAAGGLSYHALATGGTLVFLERPDPGEILRAIEAHQITELFLPPTVIYRLLAHPDIGSFDYSSLRYLIFSAAPMAVDKLREAIEVFGPVVAQFYGQTEALGITMMAPDEYLVDDRIAPDSRLSAAGRPALPFCRVSVLDDEGHPLPRGEVGEICVRGDQVMHGYYKNPAATRSVLQDGLLRTGDLGFVDDEGYIHLVDRRKDMIITGGFNVYPNEIEQVIMSLPGVEDCAVIGVPDPDWGEAVTAVVQPKASHTLEPAAIIANCRQRLDSVKTPKTVQIIDDLPRSPRGKVLKRVLRERYWQGQARRI